jgi:hypothetical protein
LAIVRASTERTESIERARRLFRRGTLGALVMGGGERTREAESVTRIRPSSPISTLSGLKSLCTRPARWAASKPRPAVTNTGTTSRHARGDAVSHDRSVLPSTSSMATNGWSP